MKIVFASNFLNHHQLPICLEFVKKTNDNFYFVATAPINVERIKFGYEDMNKKYPWVIRTYETQEQLDFAKQLILDADVVITGSAPESLIKPRLKAKKLTFRYSERVYKKKPKWYEMPLRAIKYYFKHGRYRNLYMLCASSYTASDYAKTGTFINKCFKWAYFTEVKEYSDYKVLIDNKQKNSILWVARFIPLKHPEYAIKLANRLKNESYDFEIKMIGNGVLFEKVQEVIERENLGGYVKALGSMSPERVREYMEKSEIHIFTSDRNEGWGAVLNEAMNSACACVSSDAIGATSFLIDDGQSGLIYKDGDFEDFYNKVKFLLDNAEKRKEISKSAYETMVNEWNPQNAVERFINLVKSLSGENIGQNIFFDGPCSKS